MKATLVKSFPQCGEWRENAYSLFGFAAEEYCSLFDTTLDKLDDRYIFGAILESDTLDEVMNVVQVLDSNAVVLIFDVRNVSTDFVSALKSRVESETGFRELDNVYDPSSRIVFYR